MMIENSFQSTMITEWDLVCEDKWMKTFAKLLLFSGIKDTTLANTSLIMHKGQAKSRLSVTIATQCSK